MTCSATFTTRQTAKAFVTLWKRYKKFGKDMLVLDNASVHKSKVTMDKLAEFKGDIVLYYIPPYTPELNPIEVQWGIIKKATANTLYESTGTMKDSMRRMLKSGEMGVAKLSQYLR